MEPWNMAYTVTDRFKLYYGDECPYKVGDRVESPVVDGRGNTTEFRGDSYIESLRYTVMYADDAEIIAGAVHYYEVPARWRGESQCPTD